MQPLPPPPSPLRMLLNAETWLHIAEYLTLEDIDALWRCNNMYLRTLLQRLKRAPPMTVHYKHQKWPAWLSQCKHLTSLMIRTSPSIRPKKSKSANGVVVDRALGDKWCAAFWRDAMQTQWSPHTLKGLLLRLSSNATKAFWLACKNGGSAATTTLAHASSQDKPSYSVLSKIRLAFPKLTSLKITTTDTPFTIESSLRLSDWISNHNNDNNLLQQPYQNDDDATTLFHTLHLNGLTEYEPRTPHLIQYLPQTLMDLELSFYNGIHNDDDDENLPAQSPPPQAYIAWDEHTVTFPPYLTRLSLEGVSSYLLQPSVFATLHHLEQLQLTFGSNKLDKALQLISSQLLQSPLSQLPSTVHTLEVNDVSYNRLLVHMEQIPSNNRLTSLTVRDVRKAITITDMHDFKRLVEYLVSNVKFRQLEALHVWPAFVFLNPNAVPSLSGMECMRRLRSITAVFLDPRLSRQWRKHLPLPISDADPPLRVITNHHDCRRYIPVYHNWAEDDTLVREVLQKLHFNTVNWITSRSDVQLPPKLTSSIHIAIMASDMYRNNWCAAENANSSVEMTTTTTSEGEGQERQTSLPLLQPLPRPLSWAQSIQHLTNLKTLALDQDHDIACLRELTCNTLEGLLVNTSRYHPTPFESSVFDFSQPWASRLVEFHVQVAIRVSTSVTRFTESLPPTLEVLIVQLVCEGDHLQPDMTNDEYATHFNDYVTASEEERSKRELRYLPPQLRVCRIHGSNIYMTETTIRCLPKSIATLHFLHMLDVHFNPQVLLELPPNLSTCFMTSALCSDPRLKDNVAALQAPVSKLWKHLLSAPERLRFEFPVQVAR